MRARGPKGKRGFDFRVRTDPSLPPMPKPPKRSVRIVAIVNGKPWVVPMGPASGASAAAAAGPA